MAAFSTFASPLCDKLALRTELPAWEELRTACALDFSNIYLGCDDARTITALLKIGTPKSGRLTLRPSEDGIGVPPVEIDLGPLVRKPFWTTGWRFKDDEWGTARIEPPNSNSYDYDEGYSGAEDGEGDGVARYGIALPTLSPSSMPPIEWVWELNRLKPRWFSIPRGGAFQIHPRRLSLRAAARGDPFCCDYSVDLHTHTE